jgi:hypothetical protein
MRVSFIVFAGVFAVLSATAASSSQKPADPIEKLFGPWKIDRATSSVQPPPGEGERQPQGRRPGGQGGGGGGGGGRGGVPGMGGRGGFPGMGGGSGQPSEDDLHRRDVLRRRLSEAPEKIVFSRDGVMIEYADSDGRRFTLKADGKKQTRVSGDGEFSSKSRIEGSALIVEDDFGDGAKAITKYSAMLYGDERLLEIEVTVEGLPSGPARVPGQGAPRGPASNASKRTYEFDIPK